MRTLLVSLLTAITCCVSCSATLPTKREPRKASAQSIQELKAAEASAKAGDTKKATARLKKIIQQNPDSDVGDDAHFMLGNIQYGQGLYTDALANYRAVADSEYASPIENDAKIRAARSYLRLSKPDDAEKIVTGPWREPTPEQATEIERVRAETFLAQKKSVQAIEALVALADKTESTSEKEKIREQALELLDSRLSEDDLREVSGNSKFGFMRAPAKYRYALVLADQRDYSRARSALADVIDLAPQSELSERATRLIAQIDARNRVDARTIGVSLPLSGEQAATGQRALRAIQLGLGVYGPKQSNFRLAVVDSEGTADGGRRAIERLVQEDNVIAIIGGLTSKSATAEAAKAQEMGVPTIVLSQKAGITKAGDAIFRNALTSQMQMQQLADVAIKNLGLKRFAIVYPNDAYGVEYANLFWDEIKARGGEVVGAQTYDADTKDFSPQVQRLTGTFYLEDRSSEYQQRLRVYQEKNPKRSSRTSAPSVEDILPPLVDFDAVFIPETAVGVGQIVPAFAYNNVRGVRFLGTNAWNSDAIVRRAGKAVEGSVFIDSVLTTDPAFRSSEFYTSFKGTFDEEPGRNEIQAFDSAVILRQLIGSGETTRVGLQSRLASLQNAPGALGKISAAGEREFRRPTTILTVSGGKIVPLVSIQK
ncbi:MAG: penicillin-binding protein activator [Bdellovibrionota bacterium]